MGLTETFPRSRLDPRMAQCAKCGADRELHIAGVPTCPRCADLTERKQHFSQVNAHLISARAAWKQALVEQIEAENIRGSLPKGHPDGTAALHRANNALQQAAEDYRSALQQFVRYRSADE